jgi:hypothetical protein
MITKLNPEDGGGTAYETFVSNHLTPWHNPENHDFNCIQDFHPLYRCLGYQSAKKNIISYQDVDDIK